MGSLASWAGPVVEAASTTRRKARGERAKSKDRAAEWGAGSRGKILENSMQRSRLQYVSGRVVTLRNNGVGFRLYRAAAPPACFLLPRPCCGFARGCFLRYYISNLLLMHYVWANSQLLTNCKMRKSNSGMCFSGSSCSHSRLAVPW